ncbi:MAG TPA: pyridoxal phosphate-dependent aminotransferase [Luteimonas sp.]|nr:pyridoxal phosphate-dependent aminotransferase [Luteimonas sp.]
MTHATDAAHLNTNIMDTWLVENDHKVKVNLGESNVADIRLGDVLSDASWRHGLERMTLGNNDTRGSSRLRQAIADTYPDSGVGPKNILVTAGVSEAVVAVSLAHQAPGGNLVIPVPAFHALFDVPAMLGYEIRKVALDAKADFRLPVEAILAAIDSRTRIVLLNSPHNPTGAVYARHEIETVAEAAQAVGAIVVVDEHYRYLPFGPDEDWIPSAAGMRENIVAMGSVGKCFGCTGIRVGWIVTDEERLERYHHYKLLLTHTIPVLSDRIACELLDRRRELLPAIRRDIAANLRRLEATVARGNGLLKLYSPDAGSTAFVQLCGMPDSLAFAQNLLDATGVLALPGESFDLPGFLRLRLGIAPEDFARACDGIETALARAHAKPTRTAHAQTELG